MKILFATDGAKQGDAAISAFKQLALNDGDEIKIVSVVDVGVPLAVDIYGGYLPDTTELEKAAKENATKLLEDSAAKLRTLCGDKKIDISTDVLFGSPESRIVETADEMKPDLVVVGSHGYSGWERLLIGSVSDSVVHHAAVLRTGRSVCQGMMHNHHATVNSRKYDLKIRKSWKCHLIERDDPLLTFVGEFDSDIEHAGLGSIARGTMSKEYYWLDRWYNVFRFCEPDGSFRNFYCNITMPPKFENGVLDYVDLDLDVIVWPDGHVDTMDEEDFESNAIRFGYPEDVRQRALNALSELKRAIAVGGFPFNTN